MKRCDSNIGDTNHALDQERVMYYSPSWQLLEERIDEGINASVDRHQQYVWGVRYIDDIVLHRQDNNADGDYTDPASGGGIGGGAPKAADATYYHLTDAQFSTVAIIDDDAVVQERVTYSAYGIARHHWPHDVDGDGDADATDVNIISTIASGGNNLIGQANYRAECDLDRDGDVDSTDVSIANALGTKNALRYGELSSPGTPSGSPPGTGVDNIIGFDGYVFNNEAELYTVRFRWYSPELGRWLERDPYTYIDGMNLYGFVLNSPQVFSDANGAWAIELHHVYPLHLGGADEGCRIRITKDAHEAAHRYFASRGYGYGDVGRANWSKLTPRQQQACIIRSLRHAGVPNSTICEMGDDFMRGAKPGTKTVRTGKIGRVFSLGAVAGGALAICTITSDCYAPTKPFDWRQLFNADLKCRCECREFEEVWIVPSGWVRLLGGEVERDGSLLPLNDWEDYGMIGPEDCKNIEGVAAAEEVGNECGYTVYKILWTECRWGRVDIGLPKEY